MARAAIRSTGGFSSTDARRSRELRRERARVDARAAGDVEQPLVSPQVEMLRERLSEQEKPPVDRIAARAIEARGFGKRLQVISGDMLDGPLPGGHDVHLFSNVLHDWDETVVRRLLQASARALPAGGLIVVHEAYLNADKTGPLHIAGYSVLLLHACQGRCYSVAEMSRGCRRRASTRRSTCRAPPGGARWSREKVGGSASCKPAASLAFAGNMSEGWKLSSGAADGVERLRLGGRRPADGGGPERRHP